MLGQPETLEVPIPKLNPLLADCTINAEGAHTVDVIHVAEIPRRRFEQIDQPIVDRVAMLNGWHGGIAFGFRSSN